MMDEQLAHHTHFVLFDLHYLEVLEAEFVCANKSQTVVFPLDGRAIKVILFHTHPFC